MTDRTPHHPTDLEALLGLEVRSEVDPDVVYALHAVAGEGAMSVAFYGDRLAPDGAVPVVVKIVRPEVVLHQSATAKLLVMKEAVALGRLNERIPPTPHVVRLIDTGSAPMVFAGLSIDVPWIALEQVHGGAEGTTLTERITHSIRTTGFAFDPRRAATLVDALADGLHAVHEVGVIHRDMKPDNVLCCGFGEDEIFKIADFGVARPAGLRATFGLAVGTLAYAAPELMGLGDDIGAWSDVFGMAAVVYFVLTGQDYFDVSTPAKAILAAASPTRRSLAESAWLSPDLLARADAVRAIDFALAGATSAKIEVRPGRADALAGMITPWLRAIGQRPHVVAARRARLEDEDEVTGLIEWSWSPRRRGGGPERVIRDVAWDGDGRCMAATIDGLAFWNGSTWTDVPHAPAIDPQRIRFVRRTLAGCWLVADDALTLALHTPEGPQAVVPLPPSALRFEMLSGDVDELAVLVGTHEEGGPLFVSCLEKRKWFAPIPLPGMAAVSCLRQFAPERWLISGRATDGQAYAATVAPRERKVRRLESPRARAILACAGQPTLDLGLAVGTDGAVLWTRSKTVRHESIGGAVDLSAAAIDPAGRGVCASAGKIWRHRREAPALDESVAPGGSWELVWWDPSWTVPFVALFTEPGRILAVTADGDVVEGRAAASTFAPPSVRRRSGDASPS